MTCIERDTEYAPDRARALRYNRRPVKLYNYQLRFADGRVLRTGYEYVDVAAEQEWQRLAVQNFDDEVER